jgi:hypothetical protein
MTSSHSIDKQGDVVDVACSQGIKGMCEGRGVDLVVWGVVEHSVVGETSLVPEIAADANICMLNTALEILIEMRKRM